MTTKHTPGPWIAKAGPNRWNVTTATGPRTFNVAAINTDRAEQEANARLIAAAPDMLAALIAAERFVRGFEGDELNNVAPLLAQIRAVTGQTPSDTPTTKTPANERPVCRSCGGSDIRADAYAEWDTDAQDWDLSTTFDDFVCEDCGGETKVDWVPA